MYISFLFCECSWLQYRSRETWLWVTSAFRFRASAIGQITRNSRVSRKSLRSEWGFHNFRASSDRVYILEYREDFPWYASTTFEYYRCIQYYTLAKYSSIEYRATIEFSIRVSCERYCTVYRRCHLIWLLLCMTSLRIQSWLWVLLVNSDTGYVNSFTLNIAWSLWYTCTVAITRAIVLSVFSVCQSLK